mmetsp:Transcript_108505/g.315566  ORF Transcript_108505/g.315566 Transcript_108505/m.315566 type:complete len:86 (-) Transcript_108505:497-754(-)
MTVRIPIGTNRYAIFATAFSATLTSAFDDSSTSESKDLFAMAMCIDDEVNVQVRYLVVYGVCVCGCVRAVCAVCAGAGSQPKYQT